MQIKIKETKQHKASLSISFDGTKSTETSQEIDVLVAEGKLVLVECKPEKEHTLIAKTIGSKRFHLYRSESSFSPSIVSNVVYYKPIIISETEKIEEGDWAYDSLYNRIYKAERSTPPQVQFKILVLPEHFSPQQLQDIVDGKLKDGQTVFIECEQV